MGAYLRQQALGKILRRLPEKHGVKLQPAADSLFENTQTFDGAISVCGELSARKSPPQLFDKRVVAAFDTTQPAMKFLVAGGGLLHVIRRFEIIRVLVVVQFAN